MSGRGGWEKHFERQAALPLRPAAPELTAWERELERPSIGAGDALAVIAEQSVRGDALRRFVRARCMRRFVPEEIVAALGLEKAVERSVCLAFTTLRRYDAEPR